MFTKLRNLNVGFFRMKPSKGAKSVDGNKLGYLESIRGLAACAVVFAHILAAYLPGVGEPHVDNLATNSVASTLFFGLPLGFMASGHFAVVLFFVLSGFVLTYRFFQTGNQFDLHRQAAKRYFRLAIPIFVVVMVAYAMISNGLMGNTAAVAELGGSQNVGNNFNFTPTLSDAFHSATVGVIAERDAKYNPVLWTMSIEFFGSFIILGLATFIQKARHRWMIYGGAILLLGPSYYVCFILGMMLADIVHNTDIINFVRDKISRIYYIAILMLVWLIACFPVPINGLEGTIYESFLIPDVSADYIFKIWQFLGAFLLLSVIIASVRLQNILNHRFLVFLGGISFAVYLVHFLVLYSAGNYAYVLLREDFGVSASALIAGGITIVITIGAAVLWKKYVDDLSVRVSRAFADYILK